jgi:hypothetical protein
MQNTCKIGRRICKSDCFVLINWSKKMLVFVKDKDDIIGQLMQQLSLFEKNLTLQKKSSVILLFFSVCPIKPASTGHGWPHARSTRRGGRGERTTANVQGERKLEGPENGSLRWFPVLRYV